MSPARCSVLSASRVAVTFSLLLLWCVLVTTQSAWAQSDPQAVAIAQQSMAVLTGGTAISDATLNAAVTRIAGSDYETGTGVLEFKAFGESKTTLTLPSGPLAEVRDASAGVPQGSWSGADGVAHAMALHNCWTDAGALFPALSDLAQSSNANIVLSYLGQETYNGMAVYHLRASYTGSNIPSSAQLSTTDYFIATSSLLPLAIRYFEHPDNDAGTNIAVEVRLANYQAVNGAQVPFRVQQLVNGSLLLDVTVSSASLNTGLPLSDFQLGVQ